MFRDHEARGNEVGCMHGGIGSHQQCCSRERPTRAAAVTNTMFRDCEAHRNAGLILVLVFRWTRKIELTMTTIVVRSPRRRNNEMTALSLSCPEPTDAVCPSRNPSSGPVEQVRARNGATRHQIALESCRRPSSPAVALRFTSRMSFLVSILTSTRGANRFPASRGRQYAVYLCWRRRWPQ